MLLRHSMHKNLWGFNRYHTIRRTVSWARPNCLASLRKLTPPAACACWMAARTPSGVGGRPIALPLRVPDALARNHPGADPLNNHGALELGEHPHHLKHGPTGRGRGVKPLYDANKVRRGWREFR